MISFQQEAFSAAQPEIAELIHEHWLEVNDNPDVPPDIAWDRFSDLERIGILYCLTARKDKSLVGYVILITAYALHYKTRLFAHDDAFFLKKEQRKGSAGMRMIKAAEAMMKSHGADRIIWHQKTRLENGKVFAYLGYQQYETLWMKDI